MGEAGVNRVPVVDSAGRPAASRGSLMAPD